MPDEEGLINDRDDAQISEDVSDISGRHSEYAIQVESEYRLHSCEREDVDEIDAIEEQHPLR